MNVFCMPQVMTVMTVDEPLSYKASLRLMESPARNQTKTLETRSIFAQNEPITKYSARVIRRQMLTGGKIDRADRQFLRNVIEKGNLLDDESLHVLLNLLLTSP